MDKTIVGRVEKVKFPTLDGLSMRARIDTGAKTSSLWALSTKVIDDGLEVVFPVDSSDQTVTRVFAHYSKVCVSSSMGHQQVRFKVQLPVVIKKRRILATFTLADRSAQVYPVLIGRSTLTGKFVVDVSAGHPLRAAEGARSKQLQQNITEEKV